MVTFLGKQSLYRLDVRISEVSRFYICANNVLVGGTGLFACQLAKNVFHAGKVITTVSTSKIPKLKELLGENMVDQSKILDLIFLSNWSLTPL